MVRKWITRGFNVGVGDSDFMRLNIPKRAKLRYAIVSFEFMPTGDTKQFVWALTTANGLDLAVVNENHRSVIVKDGIKRSYSASGMTLDRLRYVTELFGISLEYEKYKTKLYAGVHQDIADELLGSFTLIYDI